MRSSAAFLGILSIFFLHLEMRSEDVNYTQEYIEECVECPDSFLNRRQFFLGPEIYSAHRSNESGTKQNGCAYGVRLGFDRLKRCRWYIGADVFYANGELKGKTSSHDRLRSDLTDASVEGRFGYTFQRKQGYQIAVTPYVGYGYFTERNDYRHPSPSSLHFKTHYEYVSTGFLFAGHFLPQLEAGVNFRVKYMLEPKCRRSHDPLFRSVDLGIENRFQYRVELPVTYRWIDQTFLIGIIPFWELRQYGRLANYPFNWLETKFNIYGATFELIYRL
jgi:hypothetical protein